MKRERGGYRARVLVAILNFKGSDGRTDERTNGGQTRRSRKNKKNKKLAIQWWVSVSVMREVYMRDWRRSIAGGDARGYPKRSGFHSKIDRVEKGGARRLMRNSKAKKKGELLTRWASKRKQAASVKGQTFKFEQYNLTKKKQH